MLKLPTSILAIRGAKWTTIGVGVQRFVQMTALVVLARLLGPEDFGLVAIAVIALTLVKRVKSFGLHPAFVQYRNGGDDLVHTYFFAHAALTMTSFLLVVASTPLVSSVFGDPRAGAILAVMALRLLPEGITDVFSTIATKGLEFRRQAIILVVEAVVNASVSVIFALRGWGPWSLVAGSVSGAFCSGLLWWIVMPWRPRWRINRRVGRDLLTVGTRIWSAGNLTYLIDACNRFIIARVIGIASLGVYEITTRLVHFPLQTVLGVHDRVALPAYCREQHDPERLRVWILRVTSLMLTMSALVAGVLFFTADLLIPVLFGSRWMNAIEPARALALFALLMPLLSCAPIYIARGRTRILLLFTAARAVVTVGLLYFAAHAGLVAVCATESLAAALFAPVNVLIIVWITGISIRELGRALSVPVAGLAAFSLVAGTIRFVSEPAPGAGVASLTLVFVPSVAAFVLAVYLRRRRIVAEVREVLAVAFGR